MFSFLKNGLLLLYSVISNRKQNGLRNYFFLGGELVNQLKDKFFFIYIFKWRSRYPPDMLHIVMK